MMKDECRAGSPRRKGGARRCGRFLASALALVALSLVARPAAVEAQAGRSRVLEGNRLYEEGRFQEAHQKYLEAMAEAPESSVIPFNDGNALYQDADYQRAMEAYQRAIETGDPALASAAWYNLGNALYRQQQLEPALEAYKQSLRMNPRDVDAKHNLERVLEQMQQQQQQEQQDSDSDEDEENEDEQNPQQQPNPDEQQQDQQQPNQPQEDEGDEGEDEEEQPSGDQPQDEPQQGEGQPEPRDGELSQEEAERLLDAIDENPEDVNRKPAANRGRRPRKPW